MKTKLDKLELFEDILLSFEEAWAVCRSAQTPDQKPPSVKQFFEKLINAPTSVLVELTKIDLEHRLRSGLSTLTTDYQETLDWLSKRSEENQLDDLLRYEFQLRQQFSCQPGETEIKSRFGSRCQHVADLLPTASTIPATSTVRGANDESVNHQPPSVEHVVTPGATLNQYRIEQKIGSGAFALVFRAIDHQLQRPVAIKFLRPQLSRNEKLRKRMLREAQAMAALQHPNIVSVLEIGRFKGVDFIVTELVDGDSLSKRLERSSIPLEEALELIRQLAHATEHAHQHAVIHRDIKPANVMINGEGTPLLLDFGLAQHDSSDASLTQAGDVLGTPAYMPPEQAEGRAWQADPRSDIYSLGAMLFQLTCQRLPFEGSTAEVIHQLINVAPPLPRKLNPRISSDLQTVILTCLEKEPAERYSSARDLATDLDNVLQNKPINAKPIGWLRRGFKWARRKPILAGTMAALVLASSFAIGAATQLDRFRGQRDRAISAEAKARIAQSELQTLLANDAAAAGKLARQRGQLTEAIDYFDRSLQGKVDDPNSVRIAKVDALIATLQTQAARQELELLKTASLSEAEAGKLAMWQAELALMGDSGQDDPMWLLQQARDFVVEPADQAYIEAMLAENSLDALQHFQLALELDPYHHHARRKNILLLLALAEIDRAKSQLAIARELFPASDEFMLLEAIVLAHQGDIENAGHLLHEIPTIDSERWMMACRVIDEISNQLEVCSESTNFQQSVLVATLGRFSKTCAPLLKERGWHLPPNIQKELTQLPFVLISRTNTDNLVDVATRLKTMTTVHPEGTLFTLYTEVLTTAQNHAMADDAKNANAEVAQEALKAAKASRQHPAFAGMTKRVDPYLEFSHSITLAFICKIDVEQNKQRMLEAARRIELGRVQLDTESLRTITIGLLTIEAFEEARRIADAWIESAGKKDFDAAWHRLMCDWHEGKWLAVIELHHEMSTHFPNNKSMIDLVDAAKRKVNQAMRGPTKKTDK